MQVAYNRMICFTSCNTNYYKIPCKNVTSIYLLSQQFCVMFMTCISNHSSHLFWLVNEHSGGCIGITGYSYLTRKFCNVNLLSFHNTVSRKNSLSLNKCMLCKSTKIMREMKYTAVAQQSTQNFCLTYAYLMPQ